MIKIIDYKAGNAPSVMHAVTHIGLKAEFARKKEDLLSASHIILPGVGSAKQTLNSLKDIDILPTLENMVLKEKTKFLGICVGMQVLFEHSEEEDATCLGWLKGRVIKFDDKKVRVPQMGWNEVKFCTQNLQPCNNFFYFVNSYKCVPKNKEDILGVTNYSTEFVSAINKENIYGMQFHVEKSGKAGLNLLGKILRNQ